MLACELQKAHTHTHTPIEEEEKILRVHERAGGVEQEVSG